MTTADEARAYRERLNERVEAARARPRYVRAWHCLTCDESGSGDDSDVQANQHTRKTVHATTVSTRMEER